MRPTLGTLAIRPANRQSIIGANHQDQVKADLQHRGATLSRHYSPNAIGPLTRPDGTPTPRALAARKAGEPAPTTPEAAARLHAKGQRLLNQARRLP